MLGHTDPDLTTLVTYSPTLARDGLFWILQTLTSFRWTLQIGDITSAFTCGGPLQRSDGPLYCEAPATGLPHLSGESEHAGPILVELLKTVYGLGDGPIAWHQSFVAAMTKLGFTQSSFDASVFIKRNSKNELIGVLGLTVDDVITGGTEEFQGVLKELRGVFPFGAWKVGSGVYCGKAIEQAEDFSIVVSQKAFAESILEVEMSAGRKREAMEAAISSASRGVHWDRSPTWRGGRDTTFPVRSP